MGTKQTHKRSLKLAKQFISDMSDDKLKSLIKKHEAFINCGINYKEYEIYYRRFNKTSK